MLARGDALLAVSYSGETEEIIALLEALKRLGMPIVTLTGRVHSTLAEASDIALDVSVKEEACSLNLAPTASTTVAMAVGDALAVSRSSAGTSATTISPPSSRRPSGQETPPRRAPDARRRCPAARSARHSNARRLPRNEQKRPRHDDSAPPRWPPCRHHHRRRPPPPDGKARRRNSSR